MVCTGGVGHALDARLGRHPRRSPPRQYTRRLRFENQALRLRICILSWQLPGIASVSRQLSIKDFRDPVLDRNEFMQVDI
ncbi:hypothetical protein DACRYDRAFT_23216 [Dacryopinax primogenitus]|uniref:Uncharacterized protein n=1 Tax=Dacryopinax primogenitus (strain DJM 731) TaxID=1858805 RepID=M5G8Z6_DACPD|nr:uncharacterized protein DACRYDRAFT_25715 [Dacryopinax primogenitus]XP_040627145.1 uncharacterized protein DACRYDRAFT_23216 [Dacryopinax primogenitus]EJT96475.1 hypothetical protein DACRYDRAFT_25715 [Dacryopinax primogenitus]EJU00248.1 hypothetical protein DACRYDRAFT_23216 [Dacryopinax primogenitus]